MARLLLLVFDQTAEITPMFDQKLALLSQAMDLRVQRHSVLASNIANADTPHYKARDFDFQTAMQNAMAGGKFGGGLALTRTERGHQAGAGGSGTADLKYRGETQSAVDGNTVDMDVERAQMTDNALQYQILTQLISERFRGLKSAMSSTQG